MDVLTQSEIEPIVANSKLVVKYNQAVDSQSAYEMLSAKLQEATESATEMSKTKRATKPEESTIEKVANNTIVKSMMRTAGNTIVRSLLGSLGLGGRTRRKSSWF
jgi:hypothetical protein